MVYFNLQGIKSIITSKRKGITTVCCPKVYGSNKKLPIQRARSASHFDLFPRTSGEQKREKIVVAAIDFGSTYSGYAFSFRDDFQTNPLKIHTNLWSSVQSSGVSYKAPTTVLLNPDQTFHSFGYDAEDKYAELTESEEHKEWYYFSRFKMKLMNALDISKDQTGSDRLFTKLERSMEIEDMDGKKMPFMTIIAHAIRYLKEH